MRPQWFALLTLLFLPSLSTAQYLRDSFNLKQQLGRPYPNVLKLYSVTVDEHRGVLYASGLLTKSAAIIDLTAAKEIGSVQLPERGLHELRVNPAQGNLLVTFASGQTDRLYSIDPRTNQITGTYTYTVGKGGISFLPQENHIYLADGAFVRILDGETLKILDSIRISFPAGDLVIDTIQQRLYVVSRNRPSGHVLLKVFRLAPRFPLIKTLRISSGEALGRILLDASRQRLFLLGLKTIKVLDLSTDQIITTITTPTETQSKVYSSTLQTLFLCDQEGYDHQGLRGSWSKIYRYHLATGTLDSMRLGDKATSLAIDNRRNILAVPSMHSGIVELFHLQTETIDTIDIGEAADAFALSPDGRSLYIVNRLGGSTIIRYDTQTRSLTSFYAGSWPCAAQVDSALNRLFVLNVFESSLSVFDCSTNTLLRTITLPIPEGRTDAIPTLLLVPSLHYLYIAFPEFEQLIVVDGQRMEVLHYTTIPGFHFNNHRHFAIGVLQLVAIPDRNILLLLQRVERSLKIFDLQTLDFRDSVSLAAQWPHRSAFEPDLLFYDTTAHQLFLGPHLLDPETYQTRSIIPEAEKILGQNADHSVLYSLSVVNAVLTLQYHDPETFAVQKSVPLFPLTTNAMPVVYYDRPRNELYVTEFSEATIRRYSLNESPTTVQDASPLTLNITPSDGWLVIQWQAPARTLVAMTITNVAGQVLYQRPFQWYHAGTHHITIPIHLWAKSLYFCHLYTSTHSVTRAVLLTTP